MMQYIFNKSTSNRMLSIRILPAILFIFIFLSLTYAQQQIPTGCEVATKLDFGNQSGTPTGVEQNWKSLSLIGLLVSFSLLSVMYLIGKALDSTPLLSRVKTDLIQSAVTALLLGVLYSILSFMCLLDPSEFGFKFSSFFDGARNYLEYSRNYALSSYLDISNSIMLISGLSSIRVNAPDFFDMGNFVKVGLYLLPYAGYGIVIGALNWFGSLVLLSYSLTTGFLVVLNSVEVYFLNLLLPAGVVLRCFSPTRDFGGVLIAIAIGMFVFYPILFSFSYVIIGEPDPNVSLPDMDWNSKLNVAAGLVTATAAIPFGSVIQILSQSALVGDQAVDGLNDAYASIGPALLFIYVLPAINWIILAAIVRELSKAMGQEVDISGLARMV